MDKQAGIQIHEENEGENLRVVDETGASVNYKLLNQSTIDVTVNSLNVCEIFGRAFNGDPYVQVASRPFVKGFATLCCDRREWLSSRSISVIGNPTSWTKRVALLIKARTAEEQAKVTGQSFNSEDLNDMAHLSDYLFFSEDRASEEHWHLNLQVAERTLDILADAVQNNRLHSLQIGVELDKVYTNAGAGDLDFGMPINLFLRPNKDYGNSAVAYGRVATWELKFSGTAVLSDPFAQELEPEFDAELDEEPREPSDTDKILTALERLTLGVRSIRSSVILVGWLLAAALIMSVLIK